MKRLLKMVFPTSMVFTIVIVMILNDKVECVHASDNNTKINFHPYDNNEYDKGKPIPNESEPTEKKRIHTNNDGGMMYLSFLIYQTYILLIINKNVTILRFVYSNIPNFYIEVSAFVGEWNRNGNKSELITCNRISNEAVGCMVPDNGALKYAEFDIDGSSIWLDTDHEIQRRLVEQNQYVLQAIQKSSVQQNVGRLLLTALL